MASIFFTPRSRTNEKGKAVVLLRITHDYTRKFISLDLKINPDYWSKGRQRVTSSHVAHTDINSRLAEIDQDVQEVVSRLEASAASLTATWLKEEIEKKIKGEGSTGPDGFIDFCDRKLTAY
jgi:hypothetical protein